MPSQPDMEAAHRLNPDKFPLDASKALEQEQLMTGYLADKVAKLEGKRTAEDVMKEARAAVDGGKQPQIKPKKGSEQAEVQRLDKARAAYFANKNGDTFYPIEMKEKNPFNRMKEENVLYFATAEEAEAKNFVAHDAPGDDDEEELTDEQDDDQDEDDESDEEETDEEDTDEEDDK